MSRARKSVADLAKESGLDCDTVALVLMEAGIDVERSIDVIPRSRLAYARRILELPTALEYRSVQQLAERHRAPIVEVRRKLYKAGILHEVDQFSVPKKSMERAAQILEEESVKTVDGPEGDGQRVVSEPPELVWRTVGREEQIEYLTAEEVTQIHWVLVEDYSRSEDPIEPPGPRDPNFVEGALFRAKTSLGSEDKYPTVPMAGAAMFHSLVHDHPFHNGNKRTALVSLLVFLDKNGYVFEIHQDYLFGYVIRLASHGVIKRSAYRSVDFADAEVLEVSEWVKRNMRSVNKAELRIKAHDLRSILSAYGCEFEVLSGNRMNINRGEYSTQIYYQSEGYEYPRNAIHKVRKDVRLDEEHGYDSEIFYNAGSRIPGFINKYRKTLNKLAKL